MMLCGAPVATWDARTAPACAAPGDTRSCAVTWPQHPSCGFRAHATELG
jgi:hypothetical protein